MSVGISKQYEVIITVKEHNSYTQPHNIKFYVTDIYSDRYYWKDAKVMMGLAHMVLRNFAQVFLAATRH